MIDVGTVASSALLAAIVGPVASYFAVRHFRNEDAENLARLREDLTRESKRIDAERAFLEKRFQTQYTWLYQERAKAMSEIDQALSASMGALKALGKHKERVDKSGLKGLWLAARAAHKGFSTMLRTHRLLFPKKVLQALSKVDSIYADAFNVALGDIDFGEELHEVLERTSHQWIFIYQAKNIIEQEFRRLYGSDEDAEVNQQPAEPDSGGPSAPM